MNTIDDHIEIYLEYCKYRKRLDSKTLKAYRIDLKQYATYSNTSNDHFSKSSLDSYLTILHKQYKPKTVKRKIASLKAFFHYLSYREILSENPFDKLDIRFREAKLLPKTIPFHSLQTFLTTLYTQKDLARIQHRF